MDADPFVEPPFSFKTYNTSTARRRTRQYTCCGDEAPDHGALKPWHFVVMQNEGLNASVSYWKKRQLKGN